MQNQRVKIYVQKEFMLILDKNYQYFLEKDLNLHLCDNACRYVNAKGEVRFANV